MIHNIPHLAGVARNLIFRHTSFIRRSLERGYLEDAIKETQDLTELHVDTSFDYSRPVGRPNT
jgi:hypothetical protein